jgi:hypothetical protein
MIKMRMRLFLLRFAVLGDCWQSEIHRCNEHGVQRLFRRAANHFADLCLNLPFADLNDLAQPSYVLPHFSLVAGTVAPRFLTPMLYQPDHFLLKCEKKQEANQPQ